MSFSKVENLSFYIFEFLAKDALFEEMRLTSLVSLMKDRMKVYLWVIQLPTKLLEFVMRDLAW